MLTDIILANDHLIEIVKELGKGLGIAAGFIIAAGKFYTWWKSREDKLDRQKRIDANIIGLDRSLMISRTLKQLGEDVGSMKTTAMLIHNGGGALRPDKEMFGTMLDEHVQVSLAGSHKLRETKFDFQKYVLPSGIRDMCLGLRETKQMIIHTDQLPKDNFLRNSWETQGIKTTFMIYVGVSEKGLLFFTLQYSAKVEHLTVADQHEVDIARNDLRHFYGVAVAVR